LNLNDEINPSEKKEVEKHKGTNKKQFQFLAKVGLKIK